MVAGKLDDVLRLLLEGSEPRSEEVAEIAARILYAACIASSHNLNECAGIYDEFKRNPSRKTVGPIMERFERVGWCLVEKGVEAPEACASPLELSGERLLVVGKRAQALLGEDGRCLVVRKDGRCLVALGKWNALDRVHDEGFFGRTGLIDYRGEGAGYSVDGCTVEDVLELARRAEGIDVESTVSRCRGEVLRRDVELAQRAVSEELEGCLKLLEEYERGRGGGR